MANDIRAREWLLDTVSLTIWPVGARVFIKYVEWVNPLASGDTFEIQDGNSRSVLQGRVDVNGAGINQTFNVENWMNGFKLATLVSGTLRVHIR